MTERLDTLKKARDRMLEERDPHAKVLAAPFDRDKAGVAAPTQEEIARRAYELYIERGQAPGNEREDWLEAEKELSERYGDNSLRTSA